MHYTTEDKRISFTLDRTEGGAVVITLTDTAADAETVELELTDWAPDAEHPTIAGVMIRRQRGVTARDVRVPVGLYVEIVAGALAALVELTGGPRRPRWSTARLSDDFLREIAGAYQAAPKGKRIAAVRETRDASDSQIYRWLKAARERGLLPEREN
jgi:hypothetical protein